MAVASADCAPGTTRSSPAVPLLLDRLSPGAVIRLNEARADERGVAERWVAELPDLTLDVVARANGAALLGPSGRPLASSPP